MVDLAVILPCPNCGDPVRNMPSSANPERPWYCRHCLYDRVMFGRMYTPWCVDVPVGNYL